MAKFLVGNRVVTVELEDESKLYNNANETRFIVTDGSDQWVVTDELLLDEYKPISERASSIVDAIRSE